MIFYLDDPIITYGSTCTLNMIEKINFYPIQLLLKHKIQVCSSLSPCKRNVSHMTLVHRLCLKSYLFNFIFKFIRQYPPIFFKCRFSIPQLLSHFRCWIRNKVPFYFSFIFILSINILKLNHKIQVQLFSFFFNFKFFQMLLNFYFFFLPFFIKIF